MANLPSDLDFVLDRQASPERMNRAMSYLWAAIAALQSFNPSWQAAVDQVNTYGLARINDALGPAFDQVNAQLAQLQNNGIDGGTYDPDAAGPKFQLLRSAVSGAEPATLADGQLAFNTADGKLFWLDADGHTIKSVDLPQVATNLADYNALVTGAPEALNTITELAAALQDNPAQITDILAAQSNRLRTDADQSNSDTQKLQGLSNLGIRYAFDDVFEKADKQSVAFIKTGAGTISLKAGTVIGLNGLIYRFAADTALQMPALTPGTDYTFYLCNDGTLRADANLSAPTGFDATTSRQIGGGHYAPGGNATGYNTGGDTTPAFNVWSLWDDAWKPDNADKRGMFYQPGGYWLDIYKLGVDHIVNGTSRYNVPIADGASPPKIPIAFGGDGSASYSSFTWYEANEVLQSHGKQLPSYAELCAAAFGVVENTSAGTDPVNTILREAYTSYFGMMLATGNQWDWCRDLNMRWDGASTPWAWRDSNGGRGQLYLYGDVNLVAALFGGSWGSGLGAGSRASYWVSYPWNSDVDIGARGRCDHLQHV